MAHNIWVISDTHFGHENIIKYCNRPFKSLEEMHEYIIDKWNSVVKDGDKVYHLGDVYFSDKGKILHKLKGQKRLILGNHDNAKDNYIQKFFKKILMWRMFPEFGLLLTHVPVYDKIFNDKVRKNIHGHIHNNNYIVDERYKNVSVEVIDYTPINIEELRVK